MDDTDDKAFLRNLFQIAVDAADPMKFIPANLPKKPPGRVIVVSAGKASARMAEAVETAWGPCEGLVITRYGYARPCKGIEIVEAAHPVPDVTGMIASQRMLDLLKGASETTFVLALISGGASSLLTLPQPPVTLDDKIALTKALLASGAPIQDINTIRTHISAVKGGRLAEAAFPARVLSLIMSDVAGDDPALIGSGPTVAPTTTAVDALSVLTKWKVDIPPSVIGVLERQARPSDAEAVFAHVKNRVVAAPRHSLDACKFYLRAQGYTVRELGDRIEGEASEVAKQHAAIALEIVSGLQPHDKPVVVLSGGELTVTHDGTGCGGPNAEYVLSLTKQLHSHPQISAIACDTDGVDGSAEIAGATTTSATLQRARLMELDVSDYLRRHDAHRFFKQLGESVITGPTLTNVNDFRAILVRQPLR